MLGRLVAIKDEGDDGARGEEQGCAKFEPTGSGRWENNSLREIVQIPRICLPRLAEGRVCNFGTDPESERNLRNEQENAVLEGDVGEGKGNLLRVVYVCTCVGEYQDWKAVVTGSPADTRADI